MSEIRRVVEACDAAFRRGERVALATVVSVDGSSYRRPGARMLVREGGATVGTISAGCLERDVVEHAKRVMQSRTPMLLEYETASVDNELAWGLGIGCGGTVRVLVEPLDAGARFLATLRRACGERGDAEGVVVATVYDGIAGRAAPGARLLIDAAGNVAHDGMRADVAASIAREVEAIGRTGVAADLRLDDACGGSIGLLVETILPPVPLLVFGAGPDVVPLVERARELGWHAEVVDPRARPESRLRLRTADRVTLARAEELDALVHVGPRTMAVVMSHDYMHDLAALRFLLATPARYIGVVGATHRTRRMLAAIDEGDPAATDDESLARVHAPAGLDIGADGPAEIALSIVAEMRAVLAGRQGGPLRDRAGHIHARAAVPDPC